MISKIPDGMPEWSRPIRVPEHIQITHAEPSFAIAGETSTCRLRFVLSTEPPADSTLKLQVAGGRNNKGQFGCKAPAASLADGVSLDMTPDEHSGTYVLSVPPAGLKKGDELTVTLVDCEGYRKGGHDKPHNRRRLSYKCLLGHDPWSYGDVGRNRDAGSIFPSIEGRGGS